MGNFKLRIFELIFIFARLSTIVAISRCKRECTSSCMEFSSIMRDVSHLIEAEETHNLRLEEIGYVTPDNIFGAAPAYDKCLAIESDNAILQTIGAQHFQNKYNLSLDEFSSLANECNVFESLPCECTTSETSVHPKYRSIDGRGNNLEHPLWGASNTPFLRFGSKNYEDGIYTIKKSVTGSDLPNARLLVQEVLSKAVRATPPPIMYNVFASLAVLFITHDVHYQIPMQPQNVDDEILCCSGNRRHILPPSLSNSACLPIEISKNDSFYRHEKIGCLNMVRSQIGDITGDVQRGEITNHATSYIDLSLIYGNHDSELKQIRLYVGGKFRLGKNNVLAVDSKGNYLPSMKRFADIPIASIWPTLFFRNHNYLATELAKLNCHWSDEIIFQEARRINIANIQYNFITSKLVEVAVNNTPINETFSAERRAGTFIEFAIAYRAMHYYLRSEMLFLSADDTTRKYLQSDTIGKMELLENGFDDALRGATSQSANVGVYSDELINRMGKDCKGYGTDLLAIDIQRGRDHGTPSFLHIRRKCKISPEINSFDDFNKIFNKTNVDLLRKIYKSHEDVDFYVGGIIEIWTTLGNPFVGPVLACVIRESYNNYVGGDIYYYLNPKSPHPFTKAQIDAVKNYTISNIICANTGLKETNQIWAYERNSMNPTVDCTNFLPIDLSAWKE